MKKKINTLYKFVFLQLTHYGLVTPYANNIDLSQHWLRYQAITSFDLSSMRAAGISQKMFLIITPYKVFEDHIFENSYFCQGPVS